MAISLLYGGMDKFTYFEHKIKELKVTFLGTGTSQGIPVIACNCPVCRSSDHRDKRLRTSILIENGEYTYVVDAGPDFRQQMLRENVQGLDAIMLTHEHKDHIGGIDDVRAFNFKSKQPVDIYCDERVQEAIRREYPYVFAEKKYPGVPLMNLHIIGDDPFSIPGIDVVPVMVSHHWIPVYGFRFGDLAYITDANFISDENLEKLKGVKCFILNALRQEKHISHFNLEEAVSVIQKVAPDRGYITHISHQMGLYDVISKRLPGGIELAYDGLKIET